MPVAEKDCMTELEELAGHKPILAVLMAMEEQKAVDRSGVLAGHQYCEETMAVVVAVTRTCFGIGPQADIAGSMPFAIAMVEVQKDWSEMLYAQMDCC